MLEVATRDNVSIGESHQRLDLGVETRAQRQEADPIPPHHAIRRSATRDGEVAPEHALAARENRGSANAAVEPGAERHPLRAVPTGDPARPGFADPPKVPARDDVAVRQVQEALDGEPARVESERRPLLAIEAQALDEENPTPAARMPPFGRMENSRT